MQPSDIWNSIKYQKKFCLIFYKPRKLSKTLTKENASSLESHIFWVWQTCLILSETHQLHPDFFKKFYPCCKKSRKKRQMKLVRKLQSRFTKMTTAMMMKILLIHTMIQKRTMMMNPMSSESEAVATVVNTALKR